MCKHYLLSSAHSATLFKWLSLIKHVPHSLHWWQPDSSSKVWIQIKLWSMWASILGKCRCNMLLLCDFNKNNFVPPWQRKTNQLCKIITYLNSEGRLNWTKTQNLACYIISVLFNNSICQHYNNSHLFNIAFNLVYVGKMIIILIFWSILGQDTECHVAYWCVHWCMNVCECLEESPV